MSNPNYQELVHHNQPSSLPKEDTLHSSQTSVLNQGPFMGSLPDDQCLPRPHGHAHDYDDALDDVFSIPPKTPLNPTYQRWKKATLVLNASRRFRYTTDLKGCEKRLHHLRTTAHAVRAARRFQQSTIRKDTRVSIESQALDLASEESSPCFEAPKTALTPASREAHVCITIPSNGYVCSPDQMACLVHERNPSALEELGGVEGVACVLESSSENGLKNDAQYIQERRDKFGSNTYPPQPSKPFWSFVFDACKDPELSVLMVCSLGFGIKSYGIKEGFHDGMNIAFAVVVVLLVTSIREYWQSLQFLYLSKEKSIIPVHVIREGRKLKISIFELVVGDLVSLGTGDQVPADGLFVDGHSLLLDESSMTGESGPVDIDYKRPYLLSGCKVDDGYGTMLVTGVGMKTEWGRLMAEPSEDSGEETPLQVRLNGLTTFVRKIGLSIAVLELLILVILYVTGHREGANNAGRFRPGHTSNDTIMNSIVDILERANISDILATAITLMIVAVPDGLSVAFTLSLAYAMKKMSDRALVRRLAACETMGSVTTICTDKTGTLTLNTMTVVKVCVGSDELRDAENLPHISSSLSSLLHEGIAQNSSATVFVPPGGEPEVMGSPTDKAVLMWGLRMGMNFNQVRSLSKILQVETFNSIKKRAGVAVKVVDSGKVHVHWKGAAEIVLEECNSLVGANDSILPMTAVKKRELLNVIEETSFQSLRCIAFGYREVLAEEMPSGEQLDVWKMPEGPLTLIAIVGIQDPCRPGVQEAVHQCKAAGIKVRMLTGDNIATAKAVATECGILEDGGIAIEGATFRNYSDEMRRNKLPKISVMARTKPSDKLLMVRTLREMGEVVAVTGDGTNDVPTLHEADIGLAMGIQGTEVAKESSDIIILDDNFATIVKVVCWGRSVYANIKKCIQFQLTVNVAALTINLILPFVVSGDAPLTSVQLLWVNLIVDTLAALALLASEPPTDGLLERRPPVGRKEVLISNTMVRDLLLQAVYQIVVLLIFQFRGKQLFNLDVPNAKDINNTVIFNTFVLCQLFNALNARKPEGLNIFKGLSQHGLFIGIIASTSVVQVILVECLNKFASTVKLSWNCWVTCIMVGFLSWPIAFMGKSMLTPIEGWEGRGNGRGRRKREKKEKKGKGKGERKKEKGTAQN